MEEPRAHSGNQAKTSTGAEAHSGVSGPKLRQRDLHASLGLAGWPPASRYCQRLLAVGLLCTAEQAKLVTSLTWRFAGLSKYSYNYLN